MGKGVSNPSIDKHRIAKQEPQRSKGSLRIGKMIAAEFALKPVASGTDFISGARERTTQSWRRSKRGHERARPLMERRGLVH